MAERRSMTAAEVVAKLMSDEHADLLRESLRWVVERLMTADFARSSRKRAPQSRSEALYVIAATDRSPAFALDKDVANQRDEWLVGRRYLSAGSMGPLLDERPHRPDTEEVKELQPA